MEINFKIIKYSPQNGTPPRTISLKYYYDKYLFPI